LKLALPRAAGVVDCGDFAGTQRSVEIFNFINDAQEIINDGARSTLYSCADSQLIWQVIVVLDRSRYRQRPTRLQRSIDIDSKDAIRRVSNQSDMMEPTICQRCRSGQVIVVRRAINDFSVQCALVDGQHV
jgi:hypothetical protein